MTTLLATERIKLFTTRSPWWCAALALGMTIGLAAIMSATRDSSFPMGVNQTQFGFLFGLLVVLVMAALAVTTEYRFSTIRVTFQAIPNRTAALLAKTVVVALLAAFIGEIAAFGSWAVAGLIQPGADLALTTGVEWRTVAGTGLVYGFGAVIAVAVGVLVRQSAGALSILLIEVSLVENLVTLIPRVGEDIHRWMPFTTAQHFLTGGGTRPGAPFDPTIGPWWALAYFAGFALVLLAIALAVARKRDA